MGCNDDGRIPVIDLAVQNLTGTIPTEIGFLEDLDFVFLFRNELEGTILPTEMGNLGDVDHMYVANEQSVCAFYIAKYMWFVCLLCMKKYLKYA